MEILGGDPDPQSSDTSQIYQIIDHSTEDFGGENEENKGYTETITIVSEDQNILEDEIVYVTNDNVVTTEGGQVSFVQVSDCINDLLKLTFKWITYYHLSIHFFVDWRPGCGL